MKKFFEKIFSRYLLLHLLAMALVVVALVLGARYGLDVYTHHGEGIAVPDLRGKSYQEACRELSGLSLGIVVSDSGHQRAMPANSVLLQTPGSGQKVKRGHVVYVTINSPSSPSFAIPDIVDNTSYREATARLTAMGFRLTPPQEVAGEKDWVYGITCRGRRVSNGDRVSIDHPLTLMVGKGTFDQDDVDIVDGTDGSAEGFGDTDDFTEVAGPEVSF